MKSNYFERGTPRQSITTRLPKKIVSDLASQSASISQSTNMKISRNDLLTISGILVAELELDVDSLKSVDSLSGLADLIKAKLTEKP